MPNSFSKPLPSAYEIAAPLTYDAFDLSAATTPAVEAPKTSSIDLAPKESAQKTRAEKPKKTADDWIDSQDETPKVKEKDKDKFKGPDEPSRGIAKFAASLEAVDGTPREKRAVWVVHGMGQQIPFETLDSLANGILDVLPNPTQIKPRLRTVKIADQVLQRVELDVGGINKDAAGQPLKRYELHLYETYWAPKTEGVAQLTDVVSFLWDGGLRGILNSVKSFQRAMFGGMATFSVRWRTPLWLCLALLILVALTAINGVILVSAAAQTGLAPLAFLKTHWPQLTALASCMVAVAFSFGAVLFVADLGKPQELTTPWRIVVGGFCWIAMIYTILNILGIAALMTVMLHADWLGDNAAASNASTAITHTCITGASSQSWIEGARNWVVCLFDKMPHAKLQGFSTLIILIAGLLVGATMIARAVLRSSEQRLQGHWLFIIFSVLTFVLNVAAFFGSVLILRRYFDGWIFPSWVNFLGNPAWVWPFLILFSAKMREIMVQYVGDVAIYVRPNKLDRFDAVRSEIKEAARSVVSALFTSYELKAQPGVAPKFQYDKIALVGHSLGSVIAYDTLNRLMLDDWLCEGALQVAERTATMVTFGSPLNKTAFLFTIQGKDTLHIRERLASTVQPLIMSYPKFRKLKWINVYSRNDIVSGDLKFYDLPGYQDDPVPDIAVQNVKDRDAAVPLVAHVAYWKNKTVWTELLSAIAP
ncbi:MAG TPA: hypothetical protein VLA42_17600 [Verrucomicrobiae bacterium]|jgi:hypothetical protein|nr:hypothetical protein [Verrucomicrobiae bacterium]